MSTTAYEDLVPGQIIELGEAVVDRTEMIEFARRFDPQPFHLDEEAGRNSVLGGLAASGWFTAALWMRAYVDTVLADSTSHGSPGGREVAWLAPVFAGDKLTFRAEILSARLSTSRPGLGLVELSGTTHRDADTVLRVVFTGIFATRHPHPRE